MANLNKVFLIGNLTRDPELRYTPNGTAVVEFGMAMNRTWSRAGGEKQEEACFVDVQAWARQAEVISEYCAKGRPLFVEGRLKLDSWEGKDGQRRSKLRIVVENFQFLGSRGGNQGRGNAAPREGGQNAAPPSAESGAPPADNASGGQFQIDDDIPF